MKDTKKKSYHDWQIMTKYDIFDIMTKMSRKEKKKLIDALLQCCRKWRKSCSLQIFHSILVFDCFQEWQHRGNPATLHSRITKKNKVTREYLKKVGFTLLSGPITNVKSHVSCVKKEKKYAHFFCMFYKRINSKE